MFLYLTVYMQNADHFSPLGTGVRLAIITLASMVVGVPAGRLSARISTRWLIGPGLLLIGVGLLLMSGLSADSSWTHLVPGFIVAGVGTGLVNPPLASTAVGVVAQQDAGMASGMNSTFRQIGIATAVAALGSIFTSQLSGSDAAHAGRALRLRAQRPARDHWRGGAGQLRCWHVLIRPRDFVHHAAATRARGPGHQEKVPA